MKKYSVCGIILAAGMSKRMGSFKPLLPLNNKTVIENTIDSMLDGGADKVVVVIGFNAGLLEELISKKYGDKVIIALNSDFYKTDMLFSIQIGCQKLPRCDAFFLLPGDMPVVKKTTFLKILEVWETGKYDIVFPTLNNYRKHPPLIAAKLIPEILDFKGDGGLRQIWSLHEDKIGTVSVDDLGVWVDLDTPDDYKNVLVGNSH